MTPTLTNPQSKKLYAVEFLRIWFILCVIIQHAFHVWPESCKWLLRVLGSSGFRLATDAVSFFFIIGGFFLYRSLVRRNDNAWELIKKTYIRLIPGLLFAFTICYAIGDVTIAHLPALLVLFGGTSIAPVVVGWGEWFLGTYFWVTCLFIGIFRMTPKYGWLWLGILLYMVLELRLYAPITNKSMYVQSTYYTIIGKDFTRGIIGMGWGMIAGFLADRIHLPSKWPIKVLFTVIEVICLINLFKSALYAKHFHLSAIEMELLGVVFMISVANSWGYVSTLLNKLSFIQLFSRYTFSALIGHIICMRLMFKFKNFGMCDYSSTISVIGGGILIAIIEYHLIEKIVIPKIKAFLQHENHRKETLY